VFSAGLYISDCVRPIQLRPLAADDVAAVRALVVAELSATPYLEASLSALALAIEAPGPESRGIVAVRDAEMVGLVLYGLVPGSEGAGKLHAVVVTASARLQGVGTELCNAAGAALDAQGARFIVAEVADDPRIAAGRALLTHAAFGEEARVPDFFADGVALVILRRQIA
jgi:ribosomal protein S18 acetylase RimI-like enzyme